MSRKVARIHTRCADVVWLDVNGLDLAILDHDSVSLASVGAQHRRSLELGVECSGEVAGGVSKEADARALVGVKGLAPGVHAVEEGVLANEWAMKGCSD